MLPFYHFWHNLGSQLAKPASIGSFFAQAPSGWQEADGITCKRQLSVEGD